MNTLYMRYELSTELRTQLTPEILNELAVFTTLEIWNEPNITCKLQAILLV